MCPRGSLEAADRQVCSVVDGWLIALAPVTSGHSGDHIHLRASRSFEFGGIEGRHVIEDVLHASVELTEFTIVEMA